MGHRESVRRRQSDDQARRGRERAERANRVAYPGRETQRPRYRQPERDERRRDQDQSRARERCSGVRRAVQAAGVENVTEEASQHVVPGSVGITPRAPGIAHCGSRHRARKTKHQHRKRRPRSSPRQSGVAIPKRDVQQLKTSGVNRVYDARTERAAGRPSVATRCA
jgi:hypothetical protein